MKYRIFSLFIGLLAICGFTQAQTTYTMGGSAASGRSCNAVIYDNGGPNSNYGTNREDWFIIYPQAGQGAVSLLIEEFDVAATDTLFIYNGEYTTVPASEDFPLQIGSLAVNWLNETNGIQVGEQEVGASVQNASGALTLRFVSSATSTTRSGFKLSAHCSQPCQRINAVIDFEQSSPVPHFDENLNDGYYYIDFCPGEPIHLVCHGDYPDNNYSYTQSDATTTFHWLLGAEHLDQLNASVVNYEFPEGRGSEISLTLSDVHNGVTCYAQNPVAIRVRGSADPLVSVPTLPDVCQGQPIDFAVGYDANAANIVLGPVGTTEGASLAVDSTVFIPDGPNCHAADGSQCFQSSVNFTAFPVGATVTSAADILGVRLNIEHSFIGDINIKLKCPNGSSSMLLPDHCGNLSGACSSGSYFGIYYEPDNGCLPANNPQGTGWNYCWSENTTYAQLSNYIFTSTNVGHDRTSTVDSSHVAVGFPGEAGFVQGQQYYRPYTSFNNLVGCPLNGLWQIEVCDTWGSDNGYVFSWELTLDPRLMPQDWSYDVPVDSVGWTGGNIVSTSDTTAIAVNDQPGNYTYTFTIYDSFGCSYSRDLPVLVVQQPEAFLPDTLSICQGTQSVTLDPAFNYVGNPSLVSYEWNNGATTPTISVSDTANYIVTINAYNADRSLVCTVNDTVFVDLSPMPLAEFEGDPLESCAPMHIRMTNLSGFQDGEEHPEVHVTYEWTVTNQNGVAVAASTAKDPSFNIENRGTYTVGLIVTTNGGCSDTIVKTGYFTVYPQPVVTFATSVGLAGLDAGGEVSFVNTTDLSNFTDADNLRWHWDFGDGQTSENQSTTHIYEESGHFEVVLSAITDFGCTDEATHNVHLPTPFYFYIPNAFTPDGDGYNEVWLPQGSGVDESNYSVTIFDRNGKMIFHSNNLRQGWDGTISGKPAPVGSYVYVIKTSTRDADPREYVGTVTLVR